MIPKEIAGHEHASLRIHSFHVSDLKTPISRYRKLNVEYLESYGRIITSDVRPTQIAR